MSIEVMKQALEALEMCESPWPNTKDNQVTEAITSLRQAIAEAEKQEPVALPCCGYDNPEAVKFNPHNQVVQCHNCGQVYTPQRQHEPCPYVISTREGTHHCSLSQRQWVGLTNDERCSFVDFYWENDLLSLFELLGIVEAKLKEKNT